MITDPGLAQWIVRVLSRWFCTYAILQGANILYFGPGRWVAPAFATANNLPGAPYTWGWTLLLFGLVGLAGSLLRRRWLVWLGLYGIAGWHGFFAITLADVARSNPNAPTTGFVVYGACAVASVMLASPYRWSR